MAGSTQNDPSTPSSLGSSPGRLGAEAACATACGASRCVLPAASTHPAVVDAPPPLAATLEAAVPAGWPGARCPRSAERWWRSANSRSPDCRCLAEPTPRRGRRCIDVAKVVTNRASRLSIRHRSRAAGTGSPRVGALRRFVHWKALSCSDLPVPQPTKCETCAGMIVYRSANQTTAASRQRA